MMGRIHNVKCAGNANFNYLFHSISRMYPMDSDIKPLHDHYASKLAMLLKYFTQPFYC